MIQKAPEEETTLHNHEMVESETSLEQNLPSKQGVFQWFTGGHGILVGMGIGIAVTLAGVSFLSSPQKTEAKVETKAIPAKTAESRSVTTTEVSTASVKRTLEATGTVAAFELVPVFSQATGLQIKQLIADEGDFVKSGQVLARLDDAVLQAQLTQAKASQAQAEARLAELRAGTRTEEIAKAKQNVKSAEAALNQAKSDLDLIEKRVERNKNLEAEGAIARDRLDEILNQERSSQMSLQQAQARLEEAQQQLKQLEAGTRPEVITQAEAQLAQAKAQVELILAQIKDTRVIAPRSGKIVKRNARVGDLSSPSTQLFTIIENGRLELQVKVPETRLTQIAPGQEVIITSDADSSLSLTGQIREIMPTVDEKSRQATIRVDLPADSSLKPGMFLRASIITASVQGLTIPTEAVLPQADGSAIVYVLQADNTVKAQVIEQGELRSGNQIEVQNGLKSGDRIIVKGAAYLKDGDLVSVQIE